VVALNALGWRWSAFSPEVIYGASSDPTPTPTATPTPTPTVPVTATPTAAPSPTPAAPTITFGNKATVAGTLTIGSRVKVKRYGAADTGGTATYKFQ